MKADSNKPTTVNGVMFTPEMFETMQGWYTSDLPNDNRPYYFIQDLSEIQGYFINKLDENTDERETIVSFLIRINALICELKPFTKGGSV